MPTFKTSLLQAGKTATGFVIPPEIIDQLGAGKKPPVRVTINGYTYKNTVAVMGGDFMIGVSAEHRQGAHVSAGDEIEITLELDTEPRVAEIPADFQEALEKNPAARKNFEALSYSKKQGLVLPIKDIKSADTRQKRIEKTVGALAEGKAK